MNLCKVYNLALYGTKLKREHHTTTIKHTVRTGRLTGLKKQLPVGISSRSLQRLVSSSEVNNLIAEKLITMKFANGTKLVWVGSDA